MWSKANDWLLKYSDILLALVVVSIVGLLLVKIPQELMDVLLAADITLGLGILLVALYAPSAGRLPSFPTILLLSTLFRLALNVSTTRLILLEADAGEIIYTFGELVVGGNYVVGGVIFLVLVVIQFVVIAKGSERVAEVSARFTLDAMQGKQLSIDSDLRNELITHEEARERRQALERESKLYGAMDGAMKFVKGDAIAGIIISVINLIGGLIVGVLQQGMSVAEAAQVYSLLTIGDGLVTQIPALLISVAAGIVVTRVAASERPGAGSLARDILEQAFDRPRAIAVSALFLIVLGLVSAVGDLGFPYKTFLVLGFALALVTMLRVKAAPPAADAAQEASGGGRASASVRDKSEALELEWPLTLAFHPSISEIFHDASRLIHPLVEGELQEIRAGIAQDLGLPIPAVRLVLDAQRLSSGEYEILCHGAPIASGELHSQGLPVLQDPKRLSEQGIACRPHRQHGPRLDVAWVARDVEVLRRVSVINHHQVVFKHLDLAVRQNAHEFLGIQQTGVLLDELSKRSPKLVDAVYPKHLDLQTLTQVLRHLLRDGISVSSLEPIVESLAKSTAEARARRIPLDAVGLTEFVRRDCKRLLCARYASEHNVLPSLYLSSAVEDLVYGYSRNEAIPAEEIEEVRTAIERAYAGTDGEARPVLLVSQAALRWPLRTLIQDRLPQAYVLAPDEVSPEYRAERVGVVELGASV